MDERTPAQREHSRSELSSVSSLIESLFSPFLSNSKSRHGPQGGHGKPELGRLQEGN